MITQPRPLIEVFAAIPDFRKPRGKRHPLAAICALACCALLCGYRSYKPMVLVAYKPINTIVLNGLIVMGMHFLQAG